MNVDKFCHHIHKRIKADNSTGYTLTISENSFDAQNKIIKNLGKPNDLRDCATKEYVDTIKIEILKKIFTKDHFDKLIDEHLKKIKNNSQSLAQLRSDIDHLKNNIEIRSEKSRKGK